MVSLVIGFQSFKASLPVNNVERVCRAIIVWVAVGLASCGGGGSSPSGGDPGSPQPPQTATGQFKDSNVEGLTYISGDELGVTDALGTFTYEIGRPVTFSVGEVVLGTTIGKSLVTPVDLVPNGSLESPAVRNIVSFLLTLDDDADPFNGIKISQPVQALADNWSQIDFTGASIGDGFFADANLPNEFITILSDLASMSEGSHKLPPTFISQLHLRQTLMCTYSGVYRGTFSGDDQGNLGFVVSPNVGFVGGFEYSVSSDRLGMVGLGPTFGQVAYFGSVLPLAIDSSSTFLIDASVPLDLPRGDYTTDLGSTPIDIDGDGSFVSGSPPPPQGVFYTVASLPPLITGVGADAPFGSPFIDPVIFSGATYTGAFQSRDELSGTWASENGAGTFSGNRIGGDATTVYRYVASAFVDNPSLFAFNVDEADNVEGVIYRVITDTLLTLNGSISADQTFSATVSDGSTLSGSVNPVTGFTNGTWRMESGDRAVFTGNGCKLN